MTIWHLEKPRGLRPFRRVELKGSTVTLVVGKAGGDALRVRIPKRSASAAERECRKWIGWALADGFEEIPLPKGAKLGRLSYLVGPEGPGRLRLDGPKDVYFSAEASGGHTWKVGQRVVVQGVQLDPKVAKVDFLFGSTLRARQVSPAPRPLPNTSPKRRPFAAQAARALIKLAGPAIEGHARHGKALGKLEPGRLLFAYDKGVHRFLALKHAGWDSKRVVYEAAFTSQLAPAKESFEQFCLEEFCAPLPKALEAALIASLSGEG